jgi:putative FmdB family regulatory protein
MPTYEYRCRDCGHTFEIVQRMSDEALTVCPDCGGELRKVFAPPAIAFKGSGFYATDHGKKAKDSTKNADGSTGETKDAKDAKKAPAKPEKSETSSGSSSGSPKGSS